MLETDCEDLIGSGGLLANAGLPTDGTATCAEAISVFRDWGMAPCGMTYAQSNGGLSAPNGETTLGEACSCTCASR